MKLSDLCGICIPEKYNPTRYDEYGEIIKPKLCDEEIIEKSVISTVLTQQVIPYDKMMEANESIFTTKNKLYCGE